MLSHKTNKPRQNLQYFLWRDGSFLLHPSICTNVEGLRVAEIGVATGYVTETFLLAARLTDRCSRIWLVDLARNLPPSAHIDGFDINLSQCPPKEWLPTNISVHLRDCTAPFPDELNGTYDIVHIQLFHLGVQNNDPEPIVRNLIRLLSTKRLSFIQDSIFGFQMMKLTIARARRLDILGRVRLQYLGISAGPYIRRPRDWSSDRPTRLCRHYWGHKAQLGQELVRLQAGRVTPNANLQSWPLNLPNTFKIAGLVDIETDRRLFPEEMMLFQMDTALLASEEVSYNAMEAGSARKIREMIQKCFDMRNERAFNVGRLTVIGRKPSVSSDGS